MRIPHNASAEATTASAATVRCGACRSTVLDEPIDLPSGQRGPSPCCGSLSRDMLVTVEDRIAVHAKVGFKAKRAGRGKPFIEGVHGDDLHRKSGVWMRLRRIFDRENDWYEEEVTNPATGEVVHRCAEPLSRHQGHGSAKRR